MTVAAFVLGIIDVAVAARYVRKGRYGWAAAWGTCGVVCSILATAGLAR